MSLFARLFRLIWGADVDPPLRPVLAVTFASSAGGATVWSFVALWAIRHLHASQSAVGESGAGKTTIAHHLLLGSIGVAEYKTVLGWPVHQLDWKREILYSVVEAD